MSIASEFDSTIENIKSDYEGLENLGADLTNVNKNIQNIRTCLDNIYSNLPKTTGEGSNLSLTTLKGRINVDDILGDTKQEGTPTPDTPIDINVVTGTQEVVVANKNKLPSGESGTYTSSGATHTSNGKGVYTINGTATGTSFHNFQTTPYTIKSGDYLHLGNSVANGNVAIALLISGSEQIMFRSCSTINAIQDLSSYAGKVVNYVRTFTNAQTLSNFELKPMICNLSTQTDFVEHQEQTKTLHLGDIELAKIGTYQDRIFRTSGKNLFIPTLTNNGSNIIQANASVTLNEDEYTFVASGTDMYFGQVANANTNYVDTKGTLYSIEGGEKVYFLLTNTSFKQNFITFYDENKTSLGFTQIQTYTGSATAPTNAKYFSMRIGNSSATSGTTYKIRVMVSKDTISNYEPYGSDKWYIEKNIGKVVLNGSEGWNFSTYGTKYRASLSISDIYISQADNTTSQLYSNNFIKGAYNVTNENTVTARYNTPQLNFFITFATTKTEWVNWLTTHNTKVIYPLQTPTYEEITNETLLNELNELEKMMSYNGQTNISVSGNLPMILDVSALKGE